MKKQPFFLCVLVFLFLSALSAESFRVHKVELVEMSAQEKSKKIQLGFNDAVAIKLPKNRLFFQGVELEIKIPQTLLSYKGIIAYTLYTAITPTPTANKIDYTGNRVHLDVFPARLSLILQIPLEKQHKIKTSPYTVLVPYFPLSEDSIIFVRLQPVMKGLPDNIDDLRFEFDIKPLLSNEGLLDLRVSYPPQTGEEAFSLFIDENPVKFSFEPLLLNAGVHHLAIVSEFYKNEIRTFTVEQAGTTVLEIALQDIVPTLFITAPENAKVFLDGTETVAGKTLTLTPGEHTVRFVVGDYEVFKTVNAVTGKSYNVALTVDIQIVETP